MNECKTNWDRNLKVILAVNDENRNEDENGRGMQGNWRHEIYMDGEMK